MYIQIYRSNSKLFFFQKEKKKLDDLRGIKKTHPYFILKKPLLGPDNCRIYEVYIYQKNIYILIIFKT